MRALVLGIVLTSACGRVGFDAVTDGGGDNGGGPGSFDVTVHVIGNGAVGSNPPGIACGTECTATFSAATMLEAAPAGAFTIDWQGASCSGSTCAIDSDADITVTFGGLTTAVNRVFTTTATFTGDFGGAAAGDALCQTAATNAGLNGTFVAFLSSTTIARNATDALAGSRGWALLDGTPVYDQVSDITNMSALEALDRDEHGMPLSGTSWFGGWVDGTTAHGLPDCTNFTTQVGSGQTNIITVPISPTSNSNGACLSSLHLTCFEIGKTYVQPPLTIGRTLFPTTGTFAPDTGIAGADALCQSEATAAGFSGTFVAMIASGQSISQHLGGVAGPWRRPDGHVIAIGDLSDMPTSPPSILASGAPVSSGGPNMFEQWTGAADLASPATGSCVAHLHRAPVVTAITGDVYTVDIGWFDKFPTVPCSLNFGVYCASL